MGNLWGVFVGVEQYERIEEWPALCYCGRDAAELASLFEDPACGGYDTRQIRLLTDSAPQRSWKPTYSNVITEIERLARAADERDTILFGFFGHGMAVDGVSYLFLQDSSVGSPSKTALALDDVQKTLQGSKARAKVLILDACHSGSLPGRAGAASMSETFAEKLFEGLVQSEGWAVLSACKQNERSYEDPEKQHGVFTSYLLDGLKGAADTDRDGLISITDAYDYAKLHTRRWAFDNGREQQPELKCNVTGNIVLINRHGAPLPERIRQVPIIALMGTKGGAGKSTIIAAMAELIASKGGDILIVDTDLETGGITEYLQARARSRPHIWTVLDAAYAKQRDDPADNHPTQEPWNVTPHYLAEESRFGKIYLIPARLGSDGRSAYEAMANIQPETRRNQAALEILEEMMARANQLPRKIACILIDAGAENNPLVSAGFVLAKKYGFIVSSPNPAFKAAIRRLDAMHRERYPIHQFNAMQVIVNQATPETRDLWNTGGFSGDFVQEDPTMRLVSANAEGSFDFKGVGLNKFYLDVLQVLQNRFESQEKPLLPDEGEVWVQPYLETMEDFPETLLARPRYRFLKSITAGLVGIAGAALLLSVFLFVRSGNAPQQVVTIRDLAKPQGESEGAFAATIGQLTLPAELAGRVKLDGPRLHIEGVLWPADVTRLKAVSDYEPFRDAVVQGALLSEARAKAAAQQQERTRQTCVVGGVFSIALAIFGVCQYYTLAPRRALLGELIQVRKAGKPDDFKNLIKRILREEPDKKPLFHWLREEFRQRHPWAS